MADVLGFELARTLRSGHRLRVWTRTFEGGDGRRGTKRSWVEVRDLRGTVILDEPVQTRFIYRPGRGFIRGGWFGRETKRDLARVTPETIVRRYKAILKEAR